MRILILEDEPIIAIDLEDIVLSRIDAEIVVASNALEAQRLMKDGIDFALLDVHLGEENQTSLPVAERLLRARIPFCFISGSLERLPASFRGIPKISKPFTPSQVARVLPKAA